MTRLGVATRRPLLRDVASLAGTSTATVSRVLSGSGVISAQTAERVASAAKALGYVPNSAARILARRRDRMSGFVHQAVALVESSFSQASVLGAHEGLHDAAAELGLAVITCRVSSEQMAGGVLPPALANVAVDGIVVHPRRCVEYGYLRKVAPVVAFIAPARAREGLPSVAPDNGAGMEALFNHLSGLGHRRFVFAADNLSGPHAHTAYVERRDALLALAGGGACEVVDLGGDDAAVAAFADGFMLRAVGERPGAIMAASDGIAIKIAHALAARGGRVPLDVSVTGFDGGPEAADSFPPLTTWRPDWSAVGRLAMRTLLAVV